MTCLFLSREKNPWMDKYWWIPSWEEHLELTRSQKILKGKLPSYLRGTRLLDKARMLEHIYDLVSNLPTEIFFRLLLFLDMECLVFLEAMGFGDLLKTCFESYPNILFNKFKTQRSTRPLSMDFPYMRYTNFVAENMAKSAGAFTHLFSSDLDIDFEKLPLHSKLQVDAVNSSFSAFNPLYPVVGLCLNNAYTYYIFSYDLNVYHSAPSAFSNNSHIKYIFDFPFARVEAAKWSPSGELLAILTRPPPLTLARNWIFSLTIVLAHYCPATGFVREYKIAPNEVILTNSLTASANVWCDNSSLLLVDENGIFFKKYVIDTNFSEMQEYKVGTTKSLNDLVRKMDDDSDEKPYGRAVSKYGCISASHSYPTNVVSAVMYCGNHPQELYHHSIIFYDVTAGTLLVRHDLDGFVRSLHINSSMTLYFVDENKDASFYTRFTLPPDRCRKNGWHRISVAEPGSAVKGLLIGVDHTTLEMKKLGTGCRHPADKTYSDHASVKNCDMFSKQLVETAFCRSLQACEHYALIEMNRVVTMKTSLFTNSTFSIGHGWNDGTKKMGPTSITPDGFLTLTEHSGFWTKIKIHHCPFMPVKLVPQSFYRTSKLYYEKPVNLRVIKRL